MPELIVPKAADSIYKRSAMIAKIKDVDMKGRIITGYYSAFGNEDADGDVGVKGMTLNSIAQNGPNSANPRIKLFLNHDITQTPGTIKELGEDTHGPWYRGAIGDWTLAVDFLKMVDFGAITEHSYGLSVVKRSKADTRQMLEVKVWEVSPLTHWGANPMTPLTDIGKSMSKDDQIEYFQNKLKALDKFCRDSTATDETIQNLLLEIKYLTAHIINLTSTTPPAEKGSADAGKTGEDYSDLLKSINNIKF